MTKLRVGIIGLGVGESHIQGYEKHPSCEVVKICDFNEEVLHAVGNRHPQKTLTPDSKEITSDPEIDIVSIASYDNYHRDQAIDALQNEKHVFVEKPLCLHKSELISIAELLRANPQLKLSSNLILRMSPRFIDLRKRIRSGILGKVFHMESSYDYGRVHKLTDGWRGEILNYSVTLGGGIHLIDLINWISGEKFTQVCAYGNKISSLGSVFQGNSLTTAIMKSTSGCTSLITSNYGSVTPHHHKLSVYGTCGTFEQSHADSLYFSSRDPAKIPEKIDLPHPGTHKGDLLHDFVDSIIREKNTIVEAQEVIDVMSIGLAIDESIRNQKPQTVEYLSLDE